MNFNLIINGLKKIDLELLSALKAHNQMLPISNITNSIYYQSDIQLRAAAVLIILFQDSNSLKTILIERVQDSGPHSGQIAFPGGGKETFDNSLFDTATREAFEEVGVKVELNNCITALSPVKIPISSYSVTPILSAINYKPIFKIDKSEVQNAFIVDLMQLFESETVRKINSHNIDITAPCFVFEDKIVWGATAMVLKEIKEIFKILSLYV